MSITIIAFSPTGGTLKCAQALAKGIGLIDKYIDLTSRHLETYDLQPDDIAIIAVPSYGGRVPKLAVERLDHINGNGAKAVLMAVYGNRAYEDTLVELEDRSKECGFEVIAAVSAVSRHSIVNKIAAERPDTDDYRTLEDFGKKIKDKIVSGTHLSPTLPGNRPYKKAGSAMVPKTNDDCIGCNRCVKQCPSGAIDITNPKKTDKNLCINCMRCVEICPQNAKYVPKLMIWLVSQVLKKPCSIRKAPELFI